jgi:hypothetical protein
VASVPPGAPPPPAPDVDMPPMPAVPLAFGLATPDCGGGVLSVGLGARGPAGFASAPASVLPAALGASWAADVAGASRAAVADDDEASAAWAAPLSAVMTNTDSKVARFGFIQTLRRSGWSDAAGAVPVHSLGG